MDKFLEMYMKTKLGRKILNILIMSKNSESKFSQWIKTGPDGFIGSSTEY
jgi:hypothetical protein